MFKTFICSKPTHKYLKFTFENKFRTTPNELVQVYFITVCSTPNIRIGQNRTRNSTSSE